jgi:hypothetical protein
VRRAEWSSTGKQGAAGLAAVPGEFERTEERQNQTPPHNALLRTTNRFMIHNNPWWKARMAYWRVKHRLVLFGDNTIVQANGASKTSQTWLIFY